MPRKPIDYKKSIIYKIVNADESLIYVGSTTDFTKRKNYHKNDCNADTHHNSNYYVYQMIRENGGWDAFEMKPIKEFPCENKIQLVIEEERMRKELNATLNSRKAHLTEEVKKEYAKLYQQANRDKILERQKIYHKENKEAEIEYREANKERKADYDKSYREANKDKRKEYIETHKEGKAKSDKKYREANKEKLKEYKRAYYQKNKTKHL